MEFSKRLSGRFRGYRDRSTAQEQSHVPSSRVIHPKSYLKQVLFFPPALTQGYCTVTTLSTGHSVLRKERRIGNECDTHGAFNRVERQSGRVGHVNHC